MEALPNKSVLKICSKMAENELHRNTRFINNTNVIFRSTTNFSNSSNDVKSEPYPHCKNTLDGVTQLIGCSKDERILFDLPSNSTMYAVDNENDHVDKCEIMSNIMESKSPENIDRIASGESSNFSKFYGYLKKRIVFL
ncbi:unnamed protein product [Gordionus sp. m RMFG-2023]